MSDIEDLARVHPFPSLHSRLHTITPLSCLQCPRSEPCRRSVPCSMRESSPRVSSPPKLGPKQTLSPPEREQLQELLLHDEDEDDLYLQPEDPKVHYDVIIIGAGVTGSAIARALSQFRLSVLVLEKSDDVSQGASKANSGIVHGGYDAKFGTLKAKLNRPGNQEFARLDKELNFGFKKTGSLVLAFSDREKKTLEELLENGKLNGCPDLEIITGKQVLSMEPNINKEVKWALYCPHTGICSPYEYTIALMENAIQNGIKLLLNHEVIDIQRTDLKKDGSRFIVKTREDSFSSNYIINAAGLTADRVAAMVGANNFSIVPVKGEYLILNKTQGHLAQCVLFPVPSPLVGKGLLVSPTFFGNLLLGPTAHTILQEPTRSEQEEVKTNFEIIRNIVTLARHSVPSFDVSQTLTSYAGLRAKSNSDDFIVEECKQVNGFINVAGIDSPGLSSSPAIAKMVLDILRSLHTRDQKVLLSNLNFNPYRPPIIIRKTPDWKGTIDDPDPHKNIICRCERVTEIEIIDTLHRSIPITSTDGVKKRTRAGMGFCQGRFCEPRVAALIAREINIPLAKVGRRSKGTSILPHQRLTGEDRELLSKL